MPPSSTRHGDPARNPAYDPTLSAGPGNEPYLDVNGDPTLNAADAQKAPNDNYLLTLGPLTDPLGQKQLVGDMGANIGDTDLYGSLQSIRELLSEEGDFSSAADAAMDPDAASKRGIPYYQKMLDSLAFEFATQMNALNQTGLDGAGNLFSISSNTNDDQQTVGGNTITINASNIPGVAGLAEQDDLHPGHRRCPRGQRRCVQSGEVPCSFR